MIVLNISGVDGCSLGVKSLLLEAKIQDTRPHSCSSQPSIDINANILPGPCHSSNQGGSSDALPGPSHSQVHAGPSGVMPGRSHSPALSGRMDVSLGSPHSRSASSPSPIRCRMVNTLPRPCQSVTQKLASIRGKPEPNIRSSSTLSHPAKRKTPLTKPICPKCGIKGPKKKTCRKCGRKPGDPWLSLEDAPVVQSSKKIKRQRTFSIPEDAGNVSPDYQMSLASMVDAGTNDEQISATSMTSTLFDAGVSTAEMQDAAINAFPPPEASTCVLGSSVMGTHVSSPAMDVAPTQTVMAGGTTPGVPFLGSMDPNMSNIMLQISMMMKNQQSVMNSQPGMMKNQQSVMNCQPGMMNSQPGMMNSQPGMMNSQPSMTNIQPGMTNSQPGMTNSQPGMMNSQSAALLTQSYQTVQSTTLAPTQTINSSQSQPAETSHKPVKRKSDESVAAVRTCRVKKLTFPGSTISQSSQSLTGSQPAPPAKRPKSRGTSKQQKPSKSDKCSRDGDTRASAGPVRQQKAGNISRSDAGNNDSKAGSPSCISSDAVMPVSKPQYSQTKTSSHISISAATSTPTRPVSPHIAANAPTTRRLIRPVGHRIIATSSPTISAVSNASKLSRKLSKVNSPTKSVHSGTFHMKAEPVSPGQQAKKRKNPENRKGS